MSTTAIIRAKNVLSTQIQNLFFVQSLAKQERTISFDHTKFSFILSGLLLCCGADNISHRDLARRPSPRLWATMTMAFWCGHCLFFVLLAHVQHGSHRVGIEHRHVLVLAPHTQWFLVPERLSGILWYPPGWIQCACSRSSPIATCGACQLRL